MPQAFKDYLRLTPTIDADTAKTIAVLSKAHPTIRNHPTVQRLLTDQIDHVSVSELLHVLQAILERTVDLARKAPNVSPEERTLIIAEQNVLSTSACVLSSVMSSRLHASIDKLSNIARGLSFRR